jgi:hypothetical protein
MLGDPSRRGERWDAWAGAGHGDSGQFCPIVGNGISEGCELGWPFLRKDNESRYPAQMVFYANAPISRSASSRIPHPDSPAKDALKNHRAATRLSTHRPTLLSVPSTWPSTTCDGSSQNATSSPRISDVPVPLSMLSMRRISKHYCPISSCNRPAHDDGSLTPLP